MPSTRQVYVRVTVSAPSGSAFVAVAVTVAFVVGLAGDRPTVADGAELITVTGSDVVGPELASPSETATRTRISSPSSPLPAVARVSVAAVAPTMSRSLRIHW